jgi:uncharacterized membrane protein YphA (DoxX/SURF4 family)
MKNKNNLVLVLRILLGCVFIFSGFVKAVDPLGFTYKMQDYLKEMGSLFEQFGSMAFVASIALSAFEFLLGVNLIMGNRFKLTLWGTALFMAVMTPITLWIAIANPVHDCGCFGDALVISNWQTFAKNIVIDVVLVLLFIFKESNVPVVGNKSQWVVTFYAFIFSTAISFYGYEHLPIIDFRPYKIGTNIIESMTLPENAVKDSFNIKLIYAKNGVPKDFTLDNYPKDDSSWVFIDQKSELIRKGDEPPIHDFTIDDLNQGDITEEVLQNPGYTFLLIAYDFSLADKSKSDKINQIYHYAKDNGYDFYCMTASVDEDIENYKTQTKAEYPIALADRITLKTIIRSNPGLVLIKNATVINMWHVNNLPEFKKPLDQSNLGQIQKPNNVLRVLIVGLMFLIPLLLIVFIDQKMCKETN